MRASSLAQRQRAALWAAVGGCGSAEAGCPWSDRHVAGESVGAVRHGEPARRGSGVGGRVEEGSGGREPRESREEDEERAPVGGGARRLVEDVPDLSGSRGSIVR